MEKWSRYRSPVFSFLKKYIMQARTGIWKGCIYNVACIWYKEETVLEFHWRDLSTQEQPVNCNDHLLLSCSCLSLCYFTEHAHASIILLSYRSIAACKFIVHFVSIWFLKIYPSYSIFMNIHITLKYIDDYKRKLHVIYSVPENLGHMLFASCCNIVLVNISYN